MRRNTFGFDRGSIGRATASSALATASDYLCFWTWVAVGVVPALATLAGCAVGGIVNFSVNRTWAFGSREPLLRAALRYAVVSGASALANAGLVAVGTSVLSMSPRPAWIIARALVFVGLTYPLFRGWVFAGLASDCVEVLRPSSSKQGPASLADST